MKHDVSYFLNKFVPLVPQAKYCKRTFVIFDKCVVGCIVAKIGENDWLRWSNFGEIELELVLDLLFQLGGKPFPILSVNKTI